MGAHQHLYHHILILLISSSYPINAQLPNNFFANISTLWINDPSSCPSKSFRDGSVVRFIFSTRLNDPSFSFGFYCNGECTTFLLAIFLYSRNSSSASPSVTWSANRKNPVGENSTLEFTPEGNLVLKDVGGGVAWSTNTSGRSVTGLKLTDAGNLVLFDWGNRSVWQSHDYPTDTLVAGQKLVEGQMLTASISDFNWTEGLFYLKVSSEGLFAQVRSNPPLQYTSMLVTGKKKNDVPSYAKFVNGGLELYSLNAEPEAPDLTVSAPASSYNQYMKLEPSGHLRVYQLNVEKSSWLKVLDLLKLSDCRYPLACGAYGICSNGKCSCPRGPLNETRYFLQVNDEQTSLGCSQVNPLSCEAPQYHRYIDLTGVNCYNPDVNIGVTNIESCKQACLKNCSCKAAFFRYSSNALKGGCYLQHQDFSLVNDERPGSKYRWRTFVKVQSALAASNPSPIFRRTKTSLRGTILIISIPALCSLILLLTIGTFLFRKRSSFVKDGSPDYLPGIPTRFTYEELKSATGNFSKKLGQGSFGSVYEGTMKDGNKFAVKYLDGSGPVEISFLTEVEAIGSIHHVNLVQFIGYCVDKAHRLLVYEYMSNGSLDKWIFGRNKNVRLDWKTRHKIVLDIAKGLAYLHEDCGKRILHLDIKTQNILLDNNFNAKVSDFGLSLLMDRDQSKVMTTMRGTPGYLAPEWLNYPITEKVDVFSFGIVVLEILCGRKNVDLSCDDEECIHLLQLLEASAEKGRLHDLIDSDSDDMQLHMEEAMEMMKLAVWCVQSDFSERPSMSMVVKVLKGEIAIESQLNYKFLNVLPSKALVVSSKVELNVSIPLSACILSGPR